MMADCTGLVLAGGRSSRMGSDKAELIRGDLTMLQYSRQLLVQAGVAEVVVSRNLGDGVADVVVEKGPLGGIYSVLEQCQHVNALLIMAVDMPHLTVDDLLLLKSFGESQRRAVCFEDNFFPLYLPVSPELIAYLKQQLFDDGNLKVKAMIKSVGGIFMPHPDQSRLINTNTPSQWLQSQAELGR